MGFDLNKLKLSDLESAFADSTYEHAQTALSFISEISSNDKIKKTSLALKTGLALSKITYTSLMSKKTKSQYTIRIPDTDPLFYKVLSWLLSALPEKEQHCVVVNSESSTVSGEISVNTAPPEKFIKTFYDGKRSQEVLIGNHKVVISINTSDPVSGKKKREERYSTDEILIVCNSLESKKAVLITLSNEAEKSFIRKPRFKVAQKWGSFKSLSDVPTRPLSSVILQAGQKERIMGKLNEFLSREDEYARLGIPWHAGILLYGPPGSGKTSIATSLASTLGMDIYYISLSSLDNDSALIELLNDISPRSVLLLEDIDVARATTERTDDRPGVTLSGLLNCLDGLATPHGVITIMTTNHFNKLDPALIRPGRVDILEEIGFVDSQQIKDLCSFFLGDVPNDTPKVCDTHKLVASQFVEIFKNNFNDKENALLEIGMLLSSNNSKIGVEN